MVWDVDFRCPKSYHFFNNTISKMQGKGIILKNSLLKKSKAKKLKLAHVKVAEPLE